MNRLPDSTSHNKCNCGENLSDAEIVRLAMDAADGPIFRRLWTGDASGYVSADAAELALCRRLAFFVGYDQARIERMVALSALPGDQWLHDPIYRERTVTKAIASLAASRKG